MQPPPPELVYSVVTPPDCLATTPAPRLTDPSQVHLQRGEAFSASLPDLNGDGSTQERARLCAYDYRAPS